MTQLRKLISWVGQKPKRKDAVMLAVLFALWAFYFWRLWTPDLADRVSYPEGDYSGQFLAFGAYQAERLLSGEIPLWNPYNYGGHPFLADTQAAVFYPPRLLTIVISDWLFDGWNYVALQTETILHYLLASILMYWFARSITESAAGGLTGSVVFSYGGFLTGYPPLQLAILEAAAWTPLILLGVHRAAERGHWRFRWLSISGVALGISLLAGHPQTSLFTSYLLVAYIVHQSIKKDIKLQATLLALVAVVGVGYGLALVQLIPGFEYTQLTTRAAFGFDQLAGGFPYSDLLTIIYPESLTVWSPLYQGVLPLVLAFFAIWHGYDSARFWGIVALIALTFAFGGAAITYQLAYNALPGFSLFRGQERAAFVIAFAVATMSAYGISNLSESIQKETTKRVLWIVAGSAWLLALQVFILSNVIPALNLFTLLKAAFLFALLATFAAAWLMTLPSQQNGTWLALGCSIIIFDLFSVTSNTNFEAIAARERMLITEAVDEITADDNPFRVDGRVGLGENYGTLTNIQDIRGTSPLQLAAVDTYLTALSQERRYQLLNVRYSFTDAEELELPSEIIFENSSTTPPTRVHQLERPQTRAWLATNIFDVSDDAQAIGLISDPAFNPVTDVTLEERPASFAMPDKPVNARVTLEGYQPERITLRVTSEDNGILVLSEWYYPGWRATIDGQPTEILRANAGQRAVIVESGVHFVEFTYQPASFRVGLVGSVAAMVTALILTVGGFTVGEENEDGSINSEWAI